MILTFWNFGIGSNNIRISAFTDSKILGNNDLGLRNFEILEFGGFRDLGI